MAASKFSRVADKLAVESEPGLTTAQLMLVNHDLKPGMPSINIIGSFIEFTCMEILQLSLNVVNGGLGTSWAFG